MKTSSTNGSFPAGNPIANILVIVVGAVAIGASVILGFFAFIIVGSIVLIMASIIGLRVWWFKRQMGKTGLQDTARPSNTKGGVIEGEYQVVEDDRDGE